MRHVAVTARHALRRELPAFACATSPFRIPCNPPFRGRNVKVDLANLPPRPRNFGRPDNARFVLVCLEISNLASSFFAFSADSIQPQHPLPQVRLLPSSFPCGPCPPANQLPPSIPSTCTPNPSHTRFYHESINHVAKLTLHFVILDIRLVMVHRIKALNPSSHFTLLTLTNGFMIRYVTPKCLLQKHAHVSMDTKGGRVLSPRPMHAINQGF